MSLTNLGSREINMHNEQFTLNIDKKITTYDCRKFVTLKINNRVLQCTFNNHEVTVLDVDIIAGTEVTAFWTCVGEIKACQWL